MSLLLELTQQIRGHLPVTESKWHITIKLGDMILYGTPTGLVVYPIHTGKKINGAGLSDDK